MATKKIGAGRSAPQKRAASAGLPKPDNRVALTVKVLIPLMWALDSGDVGRASERSDAGWFLQ